MRILAITTALSLAVAGPVFSQDADYDASTVLATVNGSEITLGHMIVLMERLPQQYQQLPNEQLFDGILDQLIDQAMISDSISSSAETDPERVKLVLENERWAILSNQVVDSLTKEGVSDEELQQAYDAMPAQPEYQASHILVETAEEAEELVEALNGGADFAELAKEKSTGPSGPNGGSLGWFGPGAMVPSFDAAVQAMEVGSISDPVQTQFGWHVIRLNDERDKPALEDAREELTNTILSGKIKEALDEMRAGASIERADVNIPADAIRESSLFDDK